MAKVNKSYKYRVQLSACFSIKAIYFSKIGWRFKKIVTIQREAQGSPAGDNGVVCLLNSPLFNFSVALLPVYQE
jgi:hypothetical protein